MKTFIIILCIVTTTTGYSQITTTGVPFLLLGPSPEANGMAGISSTLPLEDPIAMLSNPGQLGLQSFSRHAGYSTYIYKTQWLPLFGIPDLTYDVRAGMVGINADHFLELPFKLSLGIGYSRVYLNLGQVLIASPDGPEVIGTYHSYEVSNAYSAAFGVEYYVKLGLGVNIKKIHSHLSPFGGEQDPGAGEAKVTAYDIGFLLNVPLSCLVMDDPTESVFSLVPNTRSTLDISIAYARSNIGDQVVYGDPTEADPLPRYASVGFSAEYSVYGNDNLAGMKFFSLAFARQTEDLLVQYSSPGVATYQTGLGDINLFDGLILGKNNSTMEILTGWRMSVFELYSIRIGRFNGTGTRLYTTFGYGVHLKGVWNIIDIVTGGPSSTGILAFLREHIDGAIHYSKYQTVADDAPLDETKYKGLIITIR
ncbi:MAG: hypothetical protein L0Y80_03500 [Ignavibacteriae bacterium]|nr:hypothetical protein [Ignavibacteriota bacterium]